MEAFAYLAALAVIVAIAAYMVCQIVRDYRRRDYKWAAAGAVCLLMLMPVLLMPVETHAIKLDMPSP